MKSILLLLFVSIIAPAVVGLQAKAAEPISVNWDNWSWTAPEPPLPDTVWYDYGWDSTSNGPTPGLTGQLRAKANSSLVRRPSPPLPPGLGRVQLAGLQAPGAPPLPPVPVAPPKPATEPVTVKLTSPRNNPGRVYADSFLSLRTPDFSKGDYLYGVGVGYQVNRYWSVDARLAHHGLDASGSAIQDIGGRLVARMPFEFLSPYTFLGASFDLEGDAWHLQPGGGVELGVSRSLRGLSVFAEGGLDADLNGRSGYLFTGGVRLRF